MLILATPLLLENSGNGLAVYALYVECFKKCFQNISSVGFVVSYKQIGISNWPCKGKALNIVVFHTGENNSKRENFTRILEVILIK